MDLKKGEQIYQNIKTRLIGKEGKIVAIELHSGDYFIGKNVIEAYKKGKSKHPAKQFLFKRIGHKAVYRVT